MTALIHLKRGKDEKMYIAIDDLDEVYETGFDANTQYEFTNVDIGSAKIAMTDAIVMAQKTLANAIKYQMVKSDAILALAAEYVVKSTK